jgi:putative RecB family exonuclease
VVWPQHRKPDTFVTKDEERDWGLNGLRMLSDFHEQFDTTAVPLARERWVSTRLPNGVELYGKVDRVDGVVREGRKSGLHVLDYKTGRSVLDDEDLPGEPNAQTYVLATEDEYSREVERVRFLYLAAGAETTWEPEREDVASARERLVTVTNEMFTDREFEAHPGPHCGSCPFAHVCPDAGRVDLVDLEVGDDLLF